MHTVLVGKEVLFFFLEAGGGWLADQTLSSQQIKSCLFSSGSGQLGRTRLAVWYGGLTGLTGSRFIWWRHLGTWGWDSND